MKSAYNQGLECDHGGEEGGDDGVSPKDVGHNIYILAHQVRVFIYIYLAFLVIVSYADGLLFYFCLLIFLFIQHLSSLASARENSKSSECPIMQFRAH